MIRYLADTNIIGYLARNSSLALQQRALVALQDRALAISVITRAETRYGLDLLNTDDKRRVSVAMLLNAFPALAWTEKAADIYGDIASRLQRSGQTIGVMDTLIAAHALAEDLVLVTHNTRHFARVPGLKLEDWLV